MSKTDHSTPVAGHIRNLISHLERAGLTAHVSYEAETLKTTPPTYTEIWTLIVFDGVEEIGEVTYNLAIQGLETNLQLLVPRAVREMLDRMQVN
jgi:hypothetical protein